MTNYPKLSSLIHISSIPSQFVFLNDTIDGILSGIRYRELIAEPSSNNSTTFYKLTLITRKVGFDLFDTGLSFVFFLPDDPSQPTSEFDVSFEYNWQILGYLPEFETLSFQHTARAFFDIFIELVDITEEEFISGVVEAVIDDQEPYLVLIDKLKDWKADDGSTPLSDLTIDDLPSGYSEAEYLVHQIQSNYVDVIVAVFEAVVEDLDDIEGSVDRIFYLFRNWLDEIDKRDIEEMLIPQFHFELSDMNMAMEFPRKVLIPVDDDNEEIEDKNTRLSFHAGSLHYDSRTGIDINIVDEGTVSIDRSMIPGFKLLIEFDDIKIDLSEESDIREVSIDDRPPGFKGVYIGRADIGLPDKWFEKKNITGADSIAIVGRKLLIGTGGISGKIGLEAIEVPSDELEDETNDGSSTEENTSNDEVPEDGSSQEPNDDSTNEEETQTEDTESDNDESGDDSSEIPEDAELVFILGKKKDNGSERPGFEIGFSKFDMKFRQDVLLESKIEGSLLIPKFNAERIGVELYLDKDGDFELTSSIKESHNLPFLNIFVFKAKSLKVGKDDNNVFLEISGQLSFENNDFISQFITEPIEIEKFRINSDGSFEIDGGTVNLKESIEMPVGPARLAITALHCGSHEQEHNDVIRQYKYWGFDCGISLNPGGVDARGDGIKYYYTVDEGDLHHFLRIEGLGIDLVIPGTAPREQAVLLLQGYLALKDPVYKGSLSFQLPQAKIAGGASMEYNTKIPAWVVDANLQLSTPLPLAATGLGINGFRGLFGLRYVAAKEAVGSLSSEDSWGDYYRADKKGVNIAKLLTPSDTLTASNPFSIGAGVALGTISDNSKLFTAQLFLLASIPSLFMLEGRFDILSDQRVGLTDEDPPFSVYLAISKDSVEIGAGVDYLVPRDTGSVLDLEAILEAAFFFKNKSAWYLNLGTKDKPTNARLLNMFDAYSYLMLSASGIEAGAGVHYDFDKKVGPADVSVHAYLDLWAHISFERGQAGGGIALGGSVDIKIWGVGFYIGLDAGLSVEAPKPFRVAGFVTVCVGIDLKIKKLEKCVTLQFVWDKDSTVDTTPIKLLSPLSEGIPFAAGLHMQSGATYDLQISDSELNWNEVSSTIPLDTFVDIKFSKPLDPSSLDSNRIAFFTNPASENIELLPPRFGSRKVRHEYKILDIQLETWSGDSWIEYHPYKALNVSAVTDSYENFALDDLPIGSWQKSDLTYSQIRLLATNPFSYMEPIGGYIPEEMGLEASTLFCQGSSREQKCIEWTRPRIYSTNKVHYLDSIKYYIEGEDAEAIELGLANSAPISLAVHQGSRLLLDFPEAVVSIKLSLFTGSKQITVRYFRKKAYESSQDSNYYYQVPEFEEIGFSNFNQPDLYNPIEYDDPDNHIDRVIIESNAPDEKLIETLKVNIEKLQDHIYSSNIEDKPKVQYQLERAIEELSIESSKNCAGSSIIPGENEKEDSKNSLYKGTKSSSVKKQTLPNNFKCATFVRQVCWLTLEDWNYNQSIPSQDAIEENFQSMKDLTEKVIAPIWRPNQVYRVKLELLDQVSGPDGNVSNSSEVAYVHFKTDGSLGFYENVLEDYDLPEDDNQSDDSEVLNLFDDRQESPERFLKYYVDKQKSTPDPSGNLLYSKPLYYSDVNLYLYMKSSFAYHFFAEWPQYDSLVGSTNLSVEKYSIDIRVKDPSESSFFSSQVNPNEAPIVTASITGDQEWISDGSPRQTEDLSLISQIRNPQLSNPQLEVGERCWKVEGDEIIPASKALKTTIANLKPSKLYTAVVFNQYFGDTNSMISEKEIHRYPFKTSQYQNFQSHIGSYLLEDSSGNVKPAIFVIDHNFPTENSSSLYELARQLVQQEGTFNSSHYSDPFDYLILGHLKLQNPPPPVSVEFNFVRNKNMEEVYGLWIRSVEPIVDPRIPIEKIKNTIRLSTVSGAEQNISILFSKDRCQVFLMHNTDLLPTQDLIISFDHLSWDEQTNDYTILDSFETEVLSMPLSTL